MGGVPVGLPPHEPEACEPEACEPDSRVLLRPPAFEHDDSETALRAATGLGTAELPLPPFRQSSLPTCAWLPRPLPVPVLPSALDSLLTDAAEQDAARCKKLRDRQRAGALSFRVLCGSYASVVPDADVYTWWQGQLQLDLPNRAVLGHLAEMQRHGKVRKDAAAVLLFDHSSPGDMSDWRTFHRLANWSKRVVFDERASDGCSRRQGIAQRRNCHRAHGVFTVASIPLTRVGW